MLVLSPRAVERLEREPAPRPLPKIFRLTKGGKLIDGIFQGETINTPSMLCVEDWLFALDWAERIGGLDALIARADANAAALDRWVQTRRLDRASRGRPGDPLEHLGLPAVRRPLRRRSQQGAAEGDRASCSSRKTPPTTSAPIATRRPGFASGAARRSTPPTSRRSGRGSTGRGRRRRERASQRPHRRQDGPQAPRRSSASAASRSTRSPACRPTSSTRSSATMTASPSAARPGSTPRRWTPPCRA